MVHCLASDGRKCLCLPSFLKDSILGHSILGGEFLFSSGCVEVLLFVFGVLQGHPGVSCVGFYLSYVVSTEIP